MADPKGADRTGKSEPGSDGPARLEGDDLARRGRELDAALAARKPPSQSQDGGRPTSGMAGIGQALRLSSEFIAGILVGAGLGWFIDRMAGTSPWGLIVFLLLGFVAGVLNALRSAGLVAEVDPKAGRRPGPGSETE